MREYILALRAIWAAWNDADKPLTFDGEFYRHTLMTPFFAPPPNPYGRPKVFLAAVGEKMTEVAGEVADGIIIHGFTTEKYVKRSRCRRSSAGCGGRQRSRDRSRSRAAVRRHRHERRGDRRRRGAGVKQQIAFYGSTPAYRGVLELHGWGDLQTELNQLSKQGEWVKMGELIDDDITCAFAGRPHRAPGRRRRAEARRCAGVVDRCSFLRARTASMIPALWQRSSPDLGSVDDSMAREFPREGIDGPMNGTAPRSDRLDAETVMRREL